MTSTLAPICYGCKNFSHKYKDDMPICRAYPDKIPIKIFFEAGDCKYYIQIKEKKSWKGFY